MRNRTTLIDKYNRLSKNVEDLYEEIWKLKNPPRFSIGSAVEYKTGITDGKFIPAKVVDIKFNNPAFQNAHWEYILWVPSLNKLYTYDGENDFYDKDYVQIRKHVPNTRTKK